MSVIDAWARATHQSVIGTYYKTVAMVYRIMTATAGLTNPPTYTGASLALASAASIGDGVIHLTAKSLIGFVSVGDSFLIAGDDTQYVATGDAPASGSPQAGYSATVPVIPTVAAAASQGASVAPTWAADLAIAAHVMTYPAKLIDGTLIQYGDLRVIIPALQLGAIVPKDSDRVIIDGVTRTLINVPAMFAGDTPSRYELQAR